MSKRNRRSLFLKIGVLAVGLLAMIVVSFLGSEVGSGIFGLKPASFLKVEAPQYHPAPERPFPSLPITNTLITAWISMAVLFLLFFIGTRNMKLVPNGLQNFLELIVEAAANFIEDPAGEKHGRWFFPGEPLLRSANTDLNIPAALAVVSFIFVEYWGFKARGVSYLKTFFQVGPLWSALKLISAGNIKAGAGGLLNGFVSLFAGLLEILSHLIRMVSFTFRLFGNMTAGMILVMIMIFLVPWVLPSLFYGMEAFFGFIQAMIFAGLTLGFACAAVMEEE